MSTPPQATPRPGTATRVQALPISVPMYQPSGPSAFPGIEPTGLAASDGPHPVGPTVPPAPQWHSPYPVARPIPPAWQGVARPSVGPLRAVELFFRNGLTFSGRASRSEFWWPTLFCILAMAAGFFAAAVLPGPDVGAITGLLTVLLGLVLLVPTVSLTVRRLHDTNLSGALFCLYFITYVGWLPVWILCAMPSDPRGVQYDAPGTQPAG